MRHFAYAALALLLACALAHSSFTFLYMTNGSNPSDTNDEFSVTQPSSLYLVGDRLFVADSGKGRVLVLNASNSLSRSKVVFSPSSEAYLNNPLYMDYDYSAGILYIGGGSSGNILFYNGQGSSVDKWNPGTTNMQKVAGLLLANDTIYATDASRGQLVAFSRTTRAFAYTVIQSGGSDGLLASPQDIVLHDGRVYISDSSKGLIFVYDSNFTFLFTMGRGKGGVNLVSPRGMDFDENRLYVADASLGSVVAFSLDGYPVDVLNASTAWGNLSYPQDVIVDSGILYVADTQNKLIKAFFVNKTGGDPDVLAMIADANSTCKSLVSLQAVAARLNISSSPLSTDAYLASAQQYYDDNAFSYADSLAQKAKDDCLNAQAAISQGVELGIRRIIQSSQATVSQYRNASSTSAAMLVQFDNKASAADFALTSKNYASASDISLSLPAIAASIANGSEAAAAAQEEQQQTQSLGYVENELTALSSRIAALQSKSDQYRQDINLSGSRDLLALVQKNVDNNDFASANHSLELAKLEVSTYETTLDASAREISAALSNLTVAEAEFNSTAGKPMLFSPDLSRERALFAQAEDLVYSSPQASLQLAAQANKAAEAKSRDSQALSLAATSALVMLFFIGVIAVGFFIHITGRKKKGI